MKMEIYIQNTTNGSVEKINIKDQQYASSVLKVISKILNKEPQHDNSDDGSTQFIYLSGVQLNSLFEHMKRRDEDLARIINIVQIDNLRGVKYVDY
jgi:hypothetical protein